ncbi:MAG: hypothetical protein NXH75_02490, partial [Halobacteriovoraceae bacterium]|nr:hypothetical protein [Halobacteriovoraceae bacterium]
MKRIEIFSLFIYFCFGNFSSLADLGELPLNVCDCPEIESLALDMREVLEEAYSNEGQIPPFSFDEFNITLAIQLESAPARPCLESILENPASFYADEGEEDSSPENPFPPHIVLDANGQQVPNATFMYYREAALSGRYVVIHAEVNGEARVFLLQRNEQGETSVTSYRPTPTIEGLVIDPSTDFGLALNGPSPTAIPQEDSPPPTEGLLVQTNAAVSEDPFTGQELVQGRYGVERTFTGPQRELSFSGMLEGNEIQDTLTVSVGTTLSFDTDGQRLDDEGNLITTGETGSGQDVELRASALERYSMTTGDLLDRELSYGVTLFGEENRALRFDIDEGLYRDPVYDLEYGNAGADGEAIQGVVQSLAISRPSLAFNGGQTPQASSGSKGGGPEDATPASSGTQERGPINEHLFHLGVTGEVGEDPASFDLAFAQTGSEETSYLTYQGNLEADTTSFALGQGNEDARFNLSLNNTPHRTIGSLMYQWDNDGETEEEADVIHTLGLGHEASERRGDVTTLSYDREAISSGETPLEDGGTLTTVERTVLGAEADTEGAITLSYGTSLRQGQVVQVPLRDAEGNLTGNTSPQELATDEREFETSLTILEDGYSVTGSFSESIGSIIVDGDPTNFTGYSMGLAHSEQGGREQTTAELTLSDSEGVLGTPCENVSLGTSRNAGLANPAQQADVHNFESWTGLPEGTNCVLHHYNTNGR